MYPVLTFQYINIYLFGVFLMIAWVLFFYGLHRNALESGFSKHIFSHITSFTLLIFLSSRLMYILSHWRIEKFIFEDFLSRNDSFLTFLEKFFLASGTGGYNLSFAGGVIGFFIAFFWFTRNNKKSRLPYLDIIVPIFFAAALAGYFGALLGGQIYGVPFESIFSIQYAHKFNIVPLQKALFPLPVVYIFASIIGLIGAYFLQKKQVPKGFIGAIGIGYFSCVLFVFEFLNGNTDTFSSHIGLNIVQITSLFGMAGAFFLLLKKLKS